MNPFVFGRVVKGEHFYDRTEECKRIVDTLSAGNNIVLYAPRRYGKTSLVVKAMEELEQKGFICIYLDFMMIFSRDSFIENYSKAIMAKQGNIQKVVQKIADFVKGIKPIFSFDESGKPEFSINFRELHPSDSTIEDVIDLPEKLAEDSNKYVIIFDEFQEITKLNGEGFENILRSKIQMQSNVNYLFLGSRTHLLQDMFSNKTRAFYNSALAMQLNKLPIPDSVNYLKSRFGNYKIEISDEIAEYLIAKVENIPYYIQLLAGEIWQNLVDSPAEVSQVLIDECAKRIIDLKSDYYYALFDEQSAYQKKVLKALAITGVSVYSAEYQQRFRLSAMSSTQRAVNNLIESGIVEKQDNEFFIADPFLKSFILNYAF